MRRLFPLLLLVTSGCYADQTLGILPATPDAALHADQTLGILPATPDTALHTQPVSDGGTAAPDVAPAADVAPPDASPPAVACTPAPGPNPLRRLTADEVRASALEVLGIEVRSPRDFPWEDRLDGLRNQAEAQISSLAYVEALAAFAEAAVDQAGDQGLARILPCATPDPVCSRQVVSGLARLFFRGQISDGETAYLQAAFDEAARAEGFARAVRLLTAVMLQAPRFLYRLELAAGAPVRAGVRTVDPLERATRLAFLFRGAPPDARLLAAAESGALADSREVASQARRLLTEPRAAQAVWVFHRDWLELDRAATFSLQGEGWTPVVAGAIVEESRRFVVDRLLEADGKLADLLTSPISFRSRALSAFYGDGPVASDDFVKVSLDPTRRPGLLSRAAFLVNGDRPTRRGMQIARQLLCDQIPPPPADLEAVLPEPLPVNLSFRQRLEMFTADPKCKACHGMVDPLGFAFGHYDSLGRWQDQEGGLPVDSAGSRSSGKLVGNWRDAADLIALLSASPAVSSCYTTYWFRFAHGRPETDDDACTLSQLNRAFDGTGGDVRELMIALTQTDAFLNKRETAAGTAVYGSPPALEARPSDDPALRTKNERLWVNQVATDLMSALVPLLPDTVLLMWHVHALGEVRDAIRAGN